MFPAPGEPVTGRSKSVQHEIETKEGRPVRCGPRRLAPAGLRREQECVKEMLTGGHIEPSDSPWAFPVVLVWRSRAEYVCRVVYYWVQCVIVRVTCGARSVHSAASTSVYKEREHHDM